MSPFVLLKWELRDERDGKSDISSDEPTRAEPPGSNPTSKAKDFEATAGCGVVVTLSAPGKAFVQSLPGRRSWGPDFAAAWPSLEQSFAREDNEESPAVITDALS